MCRVNGKKFLAKTPRFCVLGSNLGTTTTFWVFFSLALPLSRPQFPRLQNRGSGKVSFLSPNSRLVCRWGLGERLLRPTKANSQLSVGGASMNNWMPQTSQNLILNNRVNLVPTKLLFLKSSAAKGWP